MEKILQEAGLTSGESNVYLTLFKLGNTSSGNLIKESQVSRSKVYDVLERLKKKGLITEMIKDGVRHFEANSAHRITDYLEEKKRNLNDTILKINELVPELEKMREIATEKQEAKVYVGTKAIQTFFIELLNNKQPHEEYLVITLAGAVWNKEIGLFFRKFHLKRAEKKIPAKILYSSQKENVPQNINFADTGLYEIRLTSEKLPAGIIIYGSIVATIHWGETPKLFAIISKENAVQYKRFFYEMFKKASKLH